MTTKLVKTEYRIESGDCLVRLIIDHKENTFQILPKKGVIFDFTHSTIQTCKVIELIREACQMGEKLLNDSKQIHIEKTDLKILLSDKEKEAVEDYLELVDIPDRDYLYGAIQKIHDNLPKLFEL